MAPPKRPPLPEDVVERFNELRGGFNELIGLRFTAIDYDAVEAELEISPALHQPYGLVHGGVHTAIVETLASVGAAVNWMAEGHHTVGLDNNTAFLRAVRSGRLRARAEPLSRGRRTQVWEVSIRDDEDQLVASGRVRMLCIEGGASMAGEQIVVKLPGMPGEDDA